MYILKLDDRGRLLLAKEIRERYGDEFAVVEAPHELVLLPIPKDPLKALRAEGKKLPKGMSVHKLRKKARQLALKEILDEAKKRQLKTRRA